MNVVITAGGIPRPGEPLYPYTQGKPKALLEINGKPMIQYVLDAVSAAKEVQQAVVIGLDDPSGLTCAKPVTYLPSQGNVFNNLKTGALKLVELDPHEKLVIAISSDLPSINAEIIDWVAQLTRASQADVYYLVISRQVMEARYPNSKRSYYWVKDVEVCGADIHALQIDLLARREDLWQSLMESRKNAFQQAALIGFDTLLGFLFHWWTLAELAQRVCRRLGIRGQVVLCPFAEAGMDVDKPAQYELVLKDMQQSP